MWRSPATTADARARQGWPLGARRLGGVAGRLVEQFERCAAPRRAASLASTALAKAVLTQISAPVASRIQAGSGMASSMRAQGFDLVQHLGVALAQPGQFEPVARDVADAQDGAAADGAAFGLEMAAGDRTDRHAKAFAARAQALDRMFELLRRGRRQPRAEAEDAARHRRVRDQRQIALDVGLAGGRPPGDDDLRFGREEHLGAVELGARLGQLAGQLLLALGPAASRRKMQQRRDGGEQHEADARSDRPANSPWSAIDVQRDRRTSAARRRPTSGRSGRCRDDRDRSPGPQPIPARERIAVRVQNSPRAGAASIPCRCPLPSQPQPRRPGFGPNLAARRQRCDPIRPNLAFAHSHEKAVNTR